VFPWHSDGQCDDATHFGQPLSWIARFCRRAAQLQVVLLGSVQVRTDTNVLIGSGDVIINSVIP
jgi:hypothetical protein